MADEDSALLSALTTEHFALQNAASGTISESGNRATLYLSALSSSLVAIGFASSKPAVLAVFVSALLPVVFLLGVFTLVRVIDTNIESIAAAERIAAIRRFYVGLRDDAEQWFPPSRMERLQQGGGRIRRSDLLFTMGSMVALVNAALAGATATLIVLLDAHAPVLASIGIGVFSGAAALVIGLVHQDRRTRPVISTSDPSERPHRL